MGRIKKYRLDHLDFEYHDLLWYDLLAKQEGYPEFCDMIDRYGEIAEDYADSFNSNIYELAHENVRITEFESLRMFLLHYALVPNEVDEAVYEFIGDHKGFQFSGDGDGLGFIVDVWDNVFLDGEPVDSLQIWLDEYKQFV